MNDTTKIVKRIPANSIGKFARVLFTDIGARDGIIIDTDDDGKECRFLGLFEQEHQWVGADQILAIGNHVTAINTGL